MALSRTTRVNLLISNGHFLSHFYVLCLPTMFLTWKDVFQVSFSQLGATVAAMSAATALLQTPVGFLVDRYGSRVFLVGGALLMTLSIATMSMATAFWQIQLLAIMSGVGNSVIHPADYAILSGSIDKDRMGRSFAIHTLSGNLGFALGAPVTAFLILSLGWRGTLATVGLLGIPVVLSILLQSTILKDQVRAVPKAGGSVLSARDLLTSRTMLLFFLFFLFGAMAGGGVQAWLITVLHTVKGIDLKLAATALTAYMVGSTMGVLFGGWFADQFKAHVLPFVTGLVIVSASMMLVIDWVDLPGRGHCRPGIHLRYFTWRVTHPARRDAEGCRAAGPDRQGVRFRQRRFAAWLGDHADSVRVPDRQGASRNGADAGGRHSVRQPAMWRIGEGVSPWRAGGGGG